LQDTDSINPHSTTIYYNVVDFLTRKMIFKRVKENGVVDQKMKALREKIKEYVAALHLEKMIINYHVHALTYVVLVNLVTLKNKIEETTYMFQP
jgi:hypothetical protein